jgi:alpha-L-fucosidase
VHLHLDGFAGKVEYAQLLNDASEIKFANSSEFALHGQTQPASSSRNTLTLTLPVQKPPVTVPVIELFLKK